MLENLCECDLSLFHPKILEAIDYIRNINKQGLDVDAIYGLLKKSLYFNSQEFSNRFSLFSLFSFILTNFHNCKLQFIPNIFDKPYKNIR